MFLKRWPGRESGCSGTYQSAVVPCILVLSGCTLQQLARSEQLPLLQLVLLLFRFPITRSLSWVLGRGYPQMHSVEFLYAKTWRHANLGPMVHTSVICRQGTAFVTAVDGCREVALQKDS